MTRNKPFLVTLLLASVGLAACSGLGDTGGGGGCTVNCGGGGGGTAAVSVTLTSSAPPASVGLISFKVTISGITLKNSSSGATANLVLTASPTVELMRLQSDSAFYGSFPSVTAGTYDSAIVAVSGAAISFANNTGAAITNANSSCPDGSVCTANLAVANSPTITLASPITVGSSGTGLDLNFNLSNAVTVSGGILAVSFDTTVPVLSFQSLPRAGSTLGSGKLDLIEDFVGVASVSGQTITVTSPSRGTLTATATSSTIFDSNPDFAQNPLCASPGTFNACVTAGQLASMDAVLNSDGTLSVQEYEPLSSVSQDLIEGQVVAVSGPTQFSMIVTDLNVAASGSVLSGLSVGDGLIVNVPNTVLPFYVDTKGLSVEGIAPGYIGFFLGQTTTDNMQPGQTVAVRPTTFTAASGASAAVSVSTVTLRYTRLTTTATAPFSQSQFNVTDFPPFFSGNFQVQAFSGTPGSPGVTNYDGVTDPTGLTAGAPVAMRALFIENDNRTLQIPFFAAKVRKP
ncbi:MAG TPA: hypothetical protein VK525_09815 [Candidatus Saccharimonadales bacterium]|nr:hypothetical protein [Candidatus Saccharimonadales bacterium]